MTSVGVVSQGGYIPCEDTVTCHNSYLTMFAHLVRVRYILLISGASIPPTGLPTRIYHTQLTSQTTFARRRSQRSLHTNCPAWLCTTLQKVTQYHQQALIRSVPYQWQHQTLEVDPQHEQLTQSVVSFLFSLHPLNDVQLPGCTYNQRGLNWTWEMSRQHNICN